MPDTSNRLAVLKLGGSVVKSTQDFVNLAHLVQEYLKNYPRIAIVVSALKGMTDDLLAKAHLISEHPIKRELDMLVSVGERISASLLCIALGQIGIGARSFTGSQAGILTCEEHTQARITHITPYRLQDAFIQVPVIVVAGFQGVSALKKEITTLGRGGSDTSAVALGLALQANRVVFFKDVGKLYSRDPQIDKNAQPYHYCNYQQAIELMNVPKFMIHPRALKLAMVNHIPLHITSPCRPHATGTLISLDPLATDKYDFSAPCLYEQASLHGAKE